jgi:crossover junction endodeoxyribonuclease RuvC
MASATRSGVWNSRGIHPHRVLGIDPAAAGATGYAVLEADATRQNEFHVLRCGAVKPSRHATPALRLEGIHRLVSGLLEEFLPGAVAVEAPFAALNIRSALLLAEVRGVVLLAAAQRQVPVESYSPREIKASVAGYGQASKEQMQVMVRSQLHLQELPRPHDAADALAVALCHIHSQRSRARMGTALDASPGSDARGGRLHNPNSRRRGSTPRTPRPR